MKKLITSIIAASMTAALSVSAFAADGDPVTANTTGEAGSKEIQVKYDDSANTTVYSVDIVWGKMQFNYSAGTWDPASHSYNSGEGSGAGFTVVEEGGDKVTIKNHTNKAVTATVAYTK